MRALLFILCSAAMPFAAAKPISGSATLAAAKLHEVCLPLASADRLTFEYSASGALDFNIHFHHGKDVAYPLKIDAAPRGGGAFKAETAEDYCLMWENKSARPVALKYRYTPPTTNAIAPTAKTAK